MPKTILITGATDGIGLQAAKKFAALDHHVLVHGRNAEKLATVRASLLKDSAGEVFVYRADLSLISAVRELAVDVLRDHAGLDILINNAGVFKTAKAVTAEGLDTRFVVNAIAPYLLAQRLIPAMPTDGRVINLSSAAQSTVDIQALRGQAHIADHFTAYAQSKLAITMCSHYLARQYRETAPMICAINPGSMLGTKMVRDGFGVAGADINIGADIIVRAALDDSFASAHGKYFDNDSGRFATPHADVFDTAKVQGVMDAIAHVLNRCY